MIKKLNSIQKAQYIEENLKRYIKSTFQIDDKTLNDQFNRKIDNEEILKGPYISGRLPFVSGKSISELIDEGILSKEFLNMTALHLERPLYKHQEEAIRKAVNNHNLVVSTGTGSGKTESFLIPILNSIAKDIEEGKKNRGIQALLLYPLNALANDQRARVREILTDYPEITFGFYTGETEEKEKNAVQGYINEFGKKPLSNEIISREISRDNPPNILFTNYSMLEFLLIRPSDENLFSKRNTSLWRYIVLDEAHTYAGALGIEISYLMKRLLGNINSEPKFILTSATLATDSSDFSSVIDFAQKLTSKKFTKDSIIISSYQKYDQPKNLIQIPPEAYSSLFNDDNLLENIYRKISSNGINLSKAQKIRELVLQSEDFYKFTKLLDKPIKTKKMIDLIGHPWTSQYLSDYLDLLARVNQEDSRILFDVRYHSFIKTLDGAYVSIKPEKKLSIKKTSIIRIGEGALKEEVAALQLGLCKYCSIPYILGHIRNDKFYQIDDEDLYEVYGEEDNRNVDLLLIKEFADMDNIDMDKKVEYILCNRCGLINDVGLVHPKECNCGDSYKVELIGYDKDENSNEKSMYAKTNIHKCISCESENNAGVVNSFYIGKDSATAIIGQLLYQSMEESYEKAIKVKQGGNPFLQVEEPLNPEENNIKQFIAFSDSRQQASYFALFFENQHVEFLRKRLILEVIKGKRNLSIDSIQNEIQYRLEEEDLLPDIERLERQGWITVLIELLDVNRKFSLSGLGQMSFNYALEETMPKEELMSFFHEMLKSVEIHKEISHQDFISIINFIFNSMRRIPAVYYNDYAMIDRETRAEYLTYRQDDRSGLVLSPDNKQKFQKSLLPYSDKGNLYTSYLTRGLDISIEEAKKILRFIWDYLQSKEIFVDNGFGSKNIDGKKITITDGQFVDWFECSKCKTVTDINLNNICIKQDCIGRLEKVNIEHIMKDNFYVQEYNKKTIEKIVIKEHTAQIQNKEARIIQNDFKNKKINILSSSTTFEMGVDVGSLDTVYMRNVPPLPANYVQRSGRAGRSKDTAAFTITFASNNSHDYTFFEDPLKMINGKITAPYFDINNTKIANRHIVSFALSMFFKENPNYFSNSRLAVEPEVMEEFFVFTEENKESIIEFVEKNNISRHFRTNYQEWLEENITGPATKIRSMHHNHTTKIKQLDEAIKHAYDNEQNTGYLLKTLKGLKNQSMLRTLSQYGVIPKYGFPVDSVSLDVPTVTRFKLDRDLATAISEYAPSSEIIVDKLKYRSRYINVGGQNSLPNYFYTKCEDCNSLTHSLYSNDEALELCKNCLSTNVTPRKRFVIPVNGFTSELDDIKEKQIKPKKTYSSDYYYVGNDGDYLEDIIYEDTLRLKSSKDTELAVLNESNFYMCNTCGYTDLVPNGKIFTTLDKEHKKSGSIYNCSNMELTKSSLGHTFFTDVVIMDILPVKYNENEIRSFMFALLEGISISLEIERNDISGIVQLIEGTYQLILFDTVAGGAGHVSRLLDENILSKVIKETLNKVNQNCCDESSSCYKCLRNYQNQRIHPLLKRGDAKKVALDIQYFINREKGTNYQIENETNEVKSWNEINDLFEDDFALLVKIDELPSSVYADLVINGKRFESYLIWESIKTAVISTEHEFDFKQTDWNLFTMNEIAQLKEHLEEAYGKNDPKHG